MHVEEVINAKKVVKLDYCLVTALTCFYLMFALLVDIIQYMFKKNSKIMHSFPNN